MRATPRMRARHALTTAAFFLMTGGLWACDGPSVVDPDGPGIVLTAGDSIPGDTLPPDTVPGDTTTVPPDTVPGDTTGNPGGGQKTSLLVVQVGAQAQDTAAVIGVGPAVYTVSRGSHVVAVDSTTAGGYGSVQLAPGRYTVRLVAYPSTYQLAPGETGTEAVVLTPNTQGSVGFELARRP
jgi:hypothetical protein